jgi:hypothetical protein
MNATWLVTLPPCWRTSFAAAPWDTDGLNCTIAVTLRDGAFLAAAASWACALGAASAVVALMANGTATATRATVSRLRQSWLDNFRAPPCATSDAEIRLTGLYIGVLRMGERPYGHSY